MKKVVCNTKFKLNPFGDGGSRRSAQIRGALSENGFVLEEDVFVLPEPSGKWQLMRWIRRAIRFVRKHYPQKQIKTLSDYIRLVKYYALRIPVVFDKYLDQDVTFLWENTNDRDMLYLLKATGHTVIGMPHNIESLVANHSATALDKEISNLRCCDVVFAISKEDTWLLHLLGVNAHYFPYFPPKEVEARLLSVRKRRECRRPNERKKFLLLGSASNYPTRKGMQMLVDAAACRTLAFDLGVAGYRTETLHRSPDCRITFYGTMTKEGLERIIEETDAVLIYQPPTTGALTRIPEMLLAGVPVFVNFDAGRNYWDVGDVHLYNSFETLFEVLEQFEPYQTGMFQKDMAAEKEFVEIMGKVCV